MHIMWFAFSLAALVCWSGSDIFSKLGCRDAADKYSHLEMVGAVGLVMGLHAAWGVFFGGTELSWEVMLTYLPVSALYILSMAVGYLGLRYIELSISSPICNSSGAIVAVLALAADGPGDTSALQLCAVAMVCLGVTALGVTEAKEDESLRAARQEASNYRYSRSALAIVLPLIYCLLDALGTFADSRVLMSLDEDSANAAYELTFFAVGLCCAVYLRLFKKQRPVLRRQVPKYLGALCETAGQLAYVYAMADTGHLVMAAPMISAYCVLSMLWARVFLREKLSRRHYLSIALVVAGIVILGVFDV